MNDNMTISHAGLQLVMKAEGLRLTAYPDPGTGGDPWTVGFGHTGPDVHPGLIISEEQAERLLREDIVFAEIGVRTYATVPLTQGQFDALTSFAFNCGIGALRGSTMLRKLNSRDYMGAADEFKRWDMAAGQHLPGLARRRADEKDMFLNGDVA